METGGGVDSDMETGFGEDASDYAESRILDEFARTPVAVGHGRDNLETPVGKSSEVKKYKLKCKK